MIYIILFAGLVTIAVSVTLLLRPVWLIDKLRVFISGYTRITSYVEAALRLGVGYTFFSYSDLSRFPGTLRIMGVILLIQGVLILMIPLDWHTRFALWSLEYTSKYLRFATIVTIPFGIFLIYAVS